MAPKAKAQTAVAATPAVLPDLGALITAITAESEYTWYGTTQDFYRSYFRYAEGKTPDLHHPVDAKGAPAPDADDAFLTKEVEELTTRMKSMQTDLKDKPCDNVTLSLLHGRPVSVKIPQCEPDAKMTTAVRQQLQNDRRVILTDVHKLDQLLEERVIRETSCKIRNVNARGAMEYFIFHRDVDMQIPSIAQPHEFVKRAAREGKSTSFDAGLTFNTTTKVPVEFGCIERLPAGVKEEDVPDYKICKTRFAIRVARQFEQANVISEIGYSLSHALTWLVAYKAGLMTVPFRDRHKYNEYMMALGLLLFEMGPKDDPRELIHVLMTNFNRAWDACSAVTKVRTQCIVCSGDNEVKLETKTCAACRNLDMFENRYEFHDGSAAADGRVKQIANMTVRMMARCPDLKTVAPTYWNFFVGLWSPQLSAFGSSEQFYIGKYQRWSYERLRTFLTIDGSIVEGRQMRMAMFARANIQIVHWEHFGANRMMQEFVNADTKNMLNAFRIHHDVRCAVVKRGLKQAASTFALKRHKGLFDHHVGSSKKGGKIGDLVCAYLFMDPSLRFVSMDELFTEARETNSILHAIKPSIETVFDQQFKPNAPEIQTKLNQYNAKISAVHEHAMKMRGLALTADEKTGAFSIQPTNPTHQVSIQKSFEKTIGVVMRDEDSKTTTTKDTKEKMSDG